MKKLILYLFAALAVLAGCNKKSNTPTAPQHSGNGGYGIGGITGLFDIDLPRNCDTTVVMPIKAYEYIYGDFTPYVTISFGSLPSDITSVVPASYGAITSLLHNYVIDSAAFHIHAVDSGAFNVTVLASSGGSLSETSDSFKLIVH